MEVTPGKIDPVTSRAETPITFEGIERTLVGMIIHELVSRGYFQEGEGVLTLEIRVGTWFSQYGDIPYAAFLREACCEGTGLKESIVVRCKGSKDPQEHAAIVLNALGYPSFQAFFNEINDELFNFLRSGLGVEEIQKPVHDDTANATAA